MILSLLIFGSIATAAAGLILDRLTGRAVGWIVPVAIAGWIAWPRGTAEANVYGAFLGAVTLAVLLILYVLVRFAQRKARLAKDHRE